LIDNGRFNGPNALHPQQTHHLTSAHHHITAAANNTIVVAANAAWQFAVAGNDRNYN